MNSNRIRDTVLTAIGGAALPAYVLACTSFSPDDTKMLFTSGDPETGAVALEVYDRESGHSERLLTLPGEVGWVRGTWTSEGKHVVALPTTGITVLPYRVRGPVRLLHWPENNDVDERWDPTGWRFRHFSFLPSPHAPPGRAALDWTSLASFALDWCPARVRSYVRGFRCRDSRKRPLNRRVPRVTRDVGTRRNAGTVFVFTFPIHAGGPTGPPRARALFQSTSHPFVRWVFTPSCRTADSGAGLFARRHSSGTPAGFCSCRDHPPASTR